jgi:ATP-dependent Lon protease
MFITTANQLHPIPPALQDRMEIIRLPGYTEDEKLPIAMQFLVAKQKENHGLKEIDVTFTEDAVLHIIRRYTREAGVRNLERELASICRKVARKVVKEGRDIKIVVNEAAIEEYLGVPKFRYGQAEEKALVGVANGLAWTEVGGELLVIEATIVPGLGKLTLTGKLGDVMQESGQAALSYVRSRAEQMGLAKDFYQKLDMHVHVPEGAIPKDGPSAGIALATAIASALTHRPVRHDIAMTGEITLRGRVLPIGGLKEKLLAAHRAQLKTVLIPLDNEKDLTEINKTILDDLKVVLVEHMDQVLEKALLPRQEVSGSDSEEEPEAAKTRFEGDVSEMPAQ